MGVFADSDELYQVMHLLWGHIKADPIMSEKLIKSRLIVQFRYRDPEGIITIDCSDGLELKINSGPSLISPIIEMSMKADVAHDFWMGKISIPMALLTGRVVSRGPTPKALALLPVINPAFAIYPKILEQVGKKSLISS